MIIFVGNVLRGGFVQEVAQNPQVNQDVVFIASKAHIADQKAEILLAAKEGCNNIIYDIDQYYDAPELLIEEIVAIKQTNNAEPILLAPTTNENNQVIAAAINQNLKRFINGGATMAEQKAELINCITGYYDVNERIDVARIKQKQEKRELKQSLYKTIGVAGACHRIGTSTQAIQIVRYLHSKGYKACFIENNSILYPNLKLNRKEQPFVSYVEKTKLAFEMDREDDDLGLITCEGIDMFYKPEKLSDIIDRNYDFLVYDYGTYSDQDFNKTSFLKDDLKFIVTGANTTELDYTLDIIANTSYSKANLIFSFTALQDQNEFLKFMADYNAAERCFFADYTPNPFILSNIDFYTKIVPLDNQEAVPEEPKKTKKRMGFFRKGAKNG